MDSLVRHSPPYIASPKCAEAYSTLSHKNIIPRLALMYNDEDPLVKAAVIEAFAKIDTTNLDFYIETGILDKNPEVACTAIEQIKKSKKKGISSGDGGNDQGGTDIRS